MHPSASVAGHRVPASAYPKTAANVVHQALNDEAVLLDLKSERYFGLDPVGAQAWAMMDGSCSVAEIAHALSTRFDASVERIERDLCDLCRELMDAGLIELAAD